MGRTRTSPRCRRTPAVPVPPTAEPNGKESSLHTCWRACGSSPVRCEGGSTCELLGTRQALAGNGFTQRSHARARLSSDGSGKGGRSGRLKSSYHVDMRPLDPSDNINAERDLLKHEPPRIVCLPLLWPDEALPLLSIATSHIPEAKRSSPLLEPVPFKARCRRPCNQQRYLAVNMRTPRRTQFFPIALILNAQNERVTYISKASTLCFSSASLPLSESISFSRSCL